MLIPLHVKSHYSLGLGTASVERLVESAARAGYPALSLTDLENLYGQVRFHAVCARKGVRPITGVELRPGFDGRRSFGSRRGRIVLLAKDDDGYANLCRIVSRRRVRPGTTSPLATGEDPVESLRGRARGIIALTDHAPTARRLVGDRVAEEGMTRLLLVRPGRGASPEPEITAASEELGIPMVADFDAVMPDPADHPLHVLLSSIRQRTTTDVLRAEDSIASPERSLPGPSAAERMFADRPDAVGETARVAEMCTADPRRERKILPPIDVPPGRRPEEHLARLCERALEDVPRDDRFGARHYADRLAREVDVIARLGYAPYLLAVGTIVAAAAERGIATAGRGSAAGSLVSWLLGITGVDPVATGLYFERFLNDRRIEPPDIDLDVDSRRRDELIEWVRRHHGSERVAMVAVHQTFKWRSALREGLKAYGVSAGAVARALDRLPPSIHGEDEAPGIDALASILPSVPRDALSVVLRLRGLPSHLSVHPAGLVIAPEPLAGLVPLERAAKGAIVTQYDQRSVEEAGLLKIDLLGNRALAEMDETIELLQRDRTGVEAPALDRWLAAGPAALPTDDAATLAAIDRGDTIGCFQLESPAVRSVLRRVPVRSLDDVVAALAVVRPGAAAGRAKRAFLRRARGAEPPTYPHPSLEERLAATHGLPLFEEDLMFALHELGGITLSEADEVRAGIVASGDDSATVRGIREGFLRRAAAEGRDADTAVAAWRVAERFAAYSFSKAHAASFALLACRCAFLRTHAPLQFACAVLNHHGGMYPPRSLAAEIVRWGITIREPSVLHSERHAGVQRGRETGPSGAAVRLGLGSVRGLRRVTMRRLLDERRRAMFRDVGDLLDRIAPSRAERRALILSGACDGLAPLDRREYPLVHEALVGVLDEELTSRALRAAVERSQALPRHGRHGRKILKWRRLVRIRNELEYLDMHPSAHPLEVLREDAAEADCVPVARLSERTGERLRTAALLAASRRVRGRTGDVLQFLTLEDETGTIEAVVPPPVYGRAGTRITTPGPYLVEGVVARDDDPQLVVEDIRPFHERSVNLPST